MPKAEKGEFFKILGVDNCSTENEIKRAYKKLALQFHPDKNQNDFSGRKQFEEVSKAFESLTLDYGDDSYRQDYDQVFFDFLRDIFGWKEDNEAGNASNFLMFFCGSKQHPCSPDLDYDLRYQETEEEEDIDGESDIDSILEIIKNRKKKGKHVPDEFKEENLLDMKSKLFQHKEDMKKDASKKQPSKKGKTPVPVAKPKPKSKKQLLAEQRRREKEMEQIAVELEEKRKEEEEKEKQRKQLEVEKQKRLEDERIKAQNEERKRREREQKEREKQQKLEQEREERRHRQQEEERKRKEEEEKRRRAEKEKADKEKAARKAAQQAAKEKEEREKAASKSQNTKRQQQQQRIEQQQYPREIPPRFQKKMKQQQQQQLQQQQQTQTQPSQQQTKISSKLPLTVGKKKDPNRFSAKEYADIIEPMDDSGWSQSAPGKGSGWGNSIETWEETNKWGSVDRQWGNKEGTQEQLVVDEGDRDTWPTIGTKGTIGDKIKASSSETGSDRGQQSSESSPKTSVSSLSMFKSDNLSTAPSTVTCNVDKKISSCASNWQGLYPPGTENWEITDDSLDKVIDAADAVSTKEPVGITTSWGGMAQGGLGGLIGARDSTVISSLPNELTSSPGLSEAQGWSKTPGKGFKSKPPTTTAAMGLNSVTASWGGTPAENAGWTEANTSYDKLSNPNGTKPSLMDTASSATNKPSLDKEVDQSELSGAGWGEIPSTSNSTWGVSTDITGASCWDDVVHKSDNTELKSSTNNKVSRWLESTGVSFSEGEWGQESVESEEGTEGSWDGWTTACKRNRAPKPPANDSNAWMNRSLKQLLDMGFKQEDAEKALKANHMNIESAIGDLLALNMSENREGVPVLTGKLQEPDPAEAARIQQHQQQTQGKMNRKQRRKLQQQQQQQQGEQQLPATKTEMKEEQTEPLVSKSETEIGETLDNLTGEENSKAVETVNTSQSEGTQLNLDSKSKLNTPATKADKTSATGVTKLLNPQTQIAGNGKRVNQPIIPTPPLATGVQSPMRPALAHPLFHPQVVQQLHLQQLRMAQGGLLQPPFTPQQFALLQQIAQLQLVQQRLAAQSVAQQHIGQKHGQQVLPTQQQLYQQQQQIALMIAQMQQQVLQQQPSLAGRHPALQFAAAQQQQSLLQQQQQQQAASAQHKNSKQTSDKAVNEVSQNKTSENTKSQPNDLSTPPSVSSEEHSQQPSPVPQSRLTQWKQPLLQDPSTVTPQSVSSTSSSSIDSKLQSTASFTPATTTSPNVLSVAQVSTVDVSDAQAPSSANTSPRTRISDPVSSKWGVDAGPKLSADPPEFKPGVPWRPALKNDKKEEGRDVASPTVVSSSNTSVPSNTEPSAPVNTVSSVPLSSTKTSDSSSTSTNPDFSNTSFNSSNAFSGQSQYDVALGSNSWQAAGSMACPQGAAKPARPPPGLGTDNALPESPLFDDKPPAWLESLIDVPSTNVNAERDQGQFSFSRFGFANGVTPWSSRDGISHPFIPMATNPQPWAAPGGPAPAMSSTVSPMSMTTSSIVSNSGFSSVSEPPKLQNPGIIWSANQPIPSAEEKLTGGLPTSSVPPAGSSTSVGPSRGNANPMSTWLVLCNLTPRTDPKALRSLCEKHGPLLTFQLNLRHGNSLIRYGSMEEAAKARASLNGLVLSGTQIGADFATDGDIGSFFEQTMDWSANPFPSNTYGNQWSFQNMLGSGTNGSEIQPGQASTAKPNQLAVSSNNEQLVSKLPVPAAGIQWGVPLSAVPVQGNPGAGQPGSKLAVSQWGSTSHGSEKSGTKPNQVPGVPWGSAPGTVPLPSYLWGSGLSQQSVGGNFAQVPSMWSFPAGVPQEAEPQSACGENGLVSPSMTTFLPPGLLNGGGDSV